MAVPAVYEDWAQVPWSLVSKSQLASGDLPRVPAGPVDAHVRSYRRGRRGSVGLYRMERSRPTAASAQQLEASARRRTLSAHVCRQCGACCDRSLAVREGERLCPMCGRMREVATFQAQLRYRR